MSAAAVVRVVAARFEAAGVSSPRNDAEILVAHVLGIPRSSLITAPDLDDARTALLEPLVARRVAREPLQHVLGVAWFRHVELAVGPGVFTPRPETELVAGVVVDEARRILDDGRTPVVIDLCTGSGAIPAAVCDEAPGARVHAIELSPEAHEYARRNLAAHDIDLRLGDAAGAFAELDGTVDVLVSNPPYVPDDALIRDPEVLEHDPGLALWGGPDGLDVVRVVVAAAERLLRPGGLLVIEHADVQGTSVPGLLMAAPGETAGWSDVSDHTDLSGRDRYCTARRARA